MEKHDRDRKAVPMPPPTKEEIERTRKAVANFYRAVREDALRPKVESHVCRCDITFD